MSLRYLHLRDLPIIIDQGTFTFLRDLIGYLGTSNKGPCMSLRYLCLRGLQIKIDEGNFTYI
jgi:hypothetical protein